MAKVIDLKRQFRLLVKRIKFRFIINILITFCPIKPTGNPVDCALCKYTQRCYRKHLKSIKWIM